MRRWPKIRPEQTAIDDTAAALIEAVDTARAENMVFAVDRLDQFDLTGLEVKANGQFIRFATSNKDGKLYSKDRFDVYTVPNGTKKLVFDITDLGCIDGQYSRVMFEDPTGEHRLYAEILTMEGEGTIRICQPQEDQEDPTVLIPLAALSVFAASCAACRSADPHCPSSLSQWVRIADSRSPAMFSLSCCGIPLLPVSFFACSGRPPKKYFAAAFSCAGEFA